MKRYRLLTVVVAVLLSAGCERELGADVLRSMEAGFEQDALAVDSEVSGTVEYALYENPKFGRERMEPDYKCAKEILAISYGFGKAIDSLKLDLQKATRNTSGASYDIVEQKLGNSVGRMWVRHIIGKTLANMFAVTNLDSVELLPMFRALKVRYPYTFSDSMWSGKRHFSGSYSMACVELSRMKLDMARASRVVANKFIDRANRGCVLRFEDEIVFARTDYSVLLPGDEVRADVFFCLRSDTDEYKVVKVEMEGRELDVENGHAEYKGRPKGNGLQQVNGMVHFIKKSDGLIRTRPVRAEYLVLDPVTAISTQTPRYVVTKTENRIGIDILGVYKTALVVKSDRGVLAGRNGEYTLLVNEPGPVKVMIWAKGYLGALRKMDSVEFMAVNELPK